MYMQLEDEFGDIVGKARRGQELEPAALARQAGLTPEDLRRIENYEWTPEDPVVENLAQGLGLHPGKLKVSAARRYFPLYPAGHPLDEMVVEMMVLGEDFLVNGYVVGCRKTGKGAVIDPGFDAEKILRTVEATGLEIEQVLLTHGHGDHVGALSEICQAMEAPAFIHAADVSLLGPGRTKIEGEIVEGRIIAIGHQSFLPLATPGHTPGGITLVNDQVAFVGDALFAGSLGGTRRRSDYDLQRKAVETGILDLQDRVVLFPGHGPATTVGEEKANNPFFA